MVKTYNRQVLAGNENLKVALYYKAGTCGKMFVCHHEV